MEVAEGVTQTDKLEKPNGVRSQYNCLQEERNPDGEHKDTIVDRLVGTFIGALRNLTNERAQRIRVRKKR